MRVVFAPAPRRRDTEVTEYAWDYRNRLVSVTDRATYGGDATQVVDYLYDVTNQLVGKILDLDGDGEETASEEYFAYDRGQILFRFDGPSASDMTDRYLWGPAVDLLLSDEKLTGPSTAGDLYWALGDNLNTVRDIAHYDHATDKTLIANHRVYDAFGNLTSETNSAIDLLFGFTGRQFDESTNLQNNLNRWYAAAVGRWVSQDPIGYTLGDTNQYGYVRNMPTCRLDPFGLWLWPWDSNASWRPSDTWGAWFGTGRDCSQENVDCNRGCMKQKPPYPYDCYGDKGKKWAHVRYCEEKCQKEYMQCLEETKTVLDSVFGTVEQAVAWVNRHRVAIGTVVVVAGVAYVVATGGLGSLTLVPALAAV